MYNNINNNGSNNNKSYWAAANSIWKTGHENLCQVCNEARHPPSECPSYKSTGPGDRTRVACVCCLGIGHRPADCWILETSVTWAPAFLQLKGSAKQHFNRVAYKNGNNCFICLQQGHSKGRCNNTKLIAEFQISRSSITLCSGTLTANPLDGHVRPNLRMVLTDFMLNNSDGAAAQQHYWDGMAELKHRMRFDVKTIYSTEVPKKEPPVAGYDFVPVKKAAEIYKKNGLTQWPQNSAALPVRRRDRHAALHLTHRPVLHGPLVPTGEPPLSTYKYK
ncbi:hypothetical protein niasHT_017954 [Heterodera trifolii]|uniref:CCHC-type domain-containing protein n=1 Tax=Heterodera trifolii TaxID=157864 RepID=A0ABD2LIQ7_9BILA